MKITLISEQDGDVVDMKAEVIMLDDTIAFIDRFLRASGFIYSGELDLTQTLGDYVAEEDTHPESNQ